MVSPPMTEVGQKEEKCTVRGMQVSIIYSHVKLSHKKKTIFGFIASQLTQPYVKNNINKHLEWRYNIDIVPNISNVAHTYLR